MSFLFQAKPERYPLKERIQVGRRANWVASRFRKQMIRGEIVYFWQSGDETTRGIYGWGEISADHPKQDSQGIYRVEVTYQCCLLDHERHDHLRVSVLKEHPVLKNLLILRSAIGTNFLLNEEEDSALRDLLIKIYGEKWAPPAVSSGAEVKQ